MDHPVASSLFPAAPAPFPTRLVPAPTLGGPCGEGLWLTAASAFPWPFPDLLSAFLLSVSCLITSPSCTSRPSPAWGRTDGPRPLDPSFHLPILLNLRLSSRRSIFFREPSPSHSHPAFGAVPAVPGAACQECAHLPALACRSCPDLRHPQE